MNLRLLTLSAAASSILTAATPMVPASMSTDNGGTKSAIDAYSDGGGVIIINQAGDTKVDNSAMNGLVFKYGETAKSSNTTLKNQISVLSADATAAEKSSSAKIDLAKVIVNPPVDGTSCDDTNPQTLNDHYSAGVCYGDLIPNGTSCDDNNIGTIGETWLDGACQGGVSENVAGNGLVYDNCESAKLTRLNAVNYCTAKGAGWRLPTVHETASYAANGVPACPASKTWTSTPAGTYHYVWIDNTYISSYGSLNPYSVRCVK